MKRKALRGKKYFLIILAALILVLVVFLPKGKSESALSDESLSETEKIRNIITKVDGIDEAYVMINTEGEDNSDIFSFGEGQGESKEKISGIVVVCSGGDRGEVKQKVSDMLSALLGIPYNRIEVVGTRH